MTGASEGINQFIHFLDSNQKTSTTQKRQATKLSDHAKYFIITLLLCPAVRSGLKLEFMSADDKPYQLW